MNKTTLTLHVKKTTKERLFSHVGDLQSKAGQKTSMSEVAEKMIIKELEENGK